MTSGRPTQAWVALGSTLLALVFSLGLSGAAEPGSRTAAAAAPVPTALHLLAGSTVALDHVRSFRFVERDRVLIGKRRQTVRARGLQSSSSLDGPGWRWSIETAWVPRPGGKAKRLTFFTGRYRAFLERGRWVCSAKLLSAGERRVLKAVSTALPSWGLALGPERARVLGVRTIADRRYWLVRLSYAGPGVATETVQIDTEDRKPRAIRTTTAGWKKGTKVRSVNRLLFKDYSLRPGRLRTYPKCGRS